MVGKGQTITDRFENDYDDINIHEMFSKLFLYENNTHRVLPLMPELPGFDFLLLRLAVSEKSETHSHLSALNYRSSYNQDRLTYFDVQFKSRESCY